MKPIDPQPALRLIVSDALAAITMVGAMGRVYAVIGLDQQPAASQSATDARPPVLEDGESLLKEVLRLKRDSYRHRHF